MAHTDKLEDSTLEAIAKQVGAIFPRVATNVSLLRQSSELGETFAIWLLRAEDIISGTTDKLAELAQNTGRWHSQVRIGGKAQVVARSIPLGGDPANWSVRQISEGDLAQAIDEAIEWIDSNVQNDPLVRIVEVPAYYITALWLVYTTEDNIVVARQPDSIQHLRRLTLYSSRDFLENLRKEQFVVGML